MHCFLLEYKQRNALCICWIIIRNTEKAPNVSRENGNSIMEKFSTIFTRSDKSGSEQLPQETAVLKFYRTLPGEDTHSEHNEPFLDKEINGNLIREGSSARDMAKKNVEITGLNGKEEMDECEGSTNLMSTVPLSSFCDNVNEDVGQENKVMSGSDMKKEEGSISNCLTLSKDSISVKISNCQVYGDSGDAKTQHMATDQQEQNASLGDYRMTEEPINTHAASDHQGMNTDSLTGGNSNDPPSEENTLDQAILNQQAISLN